MKINEIFYSLQGEGHFTGTPAVFVRLSGCNLKCDFCDTDHLPHSDMTEEDIVKRVSDFPATHVVITGGEPTLQLTASLVDKLHAAGKFVQIETNGTQNLDDNLEQKLDWVTCSPKQGGKLRISRIDELKAVFDYRQPDFISELNAINARFRYLQPCDRKEKGYNDTNTAECIKYILEHPQWRLSLQTHKILSIQ